jgi:uncharacterized protein (DUF697 family)
MSAHMCLLVGPFDLFGITVLFSFLFGEKFKRWQSSEWSGVAGALIGMAMSSVLTEGATFCLGTCALEALGLAADQLHGPNRHNFKPLTSKTH